MGRARLAARVVGGLGLMLLAGAGAGAHLPPPEDDRADYLLLLEDEALALRAQGRPAMWRQDGRRRRLDAGSVDSRAWLAHLTAKQAALLRNVAARIGRQPRVLDRFDHALNGLSLVLTPDEARQLAGLAGLRRLQRLAWRPLASDAGPAWIGAPALWDGSALGRPMGSLGQGIVIGVIDTGIHARHPSFAAVDGLGRALENPRGGYLGWCDPAHPRHNRLTAGGCNAKLIGLWSHERASMNPADENGHGSHTASTAAGNQLLGAVFGRTLPMARDLSGVAPLANLVAYDACDGSLCAEAATLAAIEQAVRDGVDVINYSITVGDASPWEGAQDQAFLGARAAGISVAVAAGNEGPAPASLSSLAPWLTTVGNASHDRSFVAEVNQASGGGSALMAMQGQGLTAAYGPAPLLTAAGRLNRLGQADDGRCLEPFPAGSLAGAILLCKRGGNGRLEKGENVLAGGAGGMLLVNGPEDGASLNSDAHALPALHLGAREGRALEAWLALGSGHRLSIGRSEVSLAPERGDRLAPGSSRGPARYQACCLHPELPIAYPADLDLLKPDLAAPGTDILAAQAAGMAPFAPEFGLLSGSSMASPHLAGGAALLLAARPDWTPAEVQSALQLTARPLRDADGEVVTALEGGAGRVDLAAAARAGLVLDESVAAFVAAEPSAGGQPATLNLAGMVSSACPGSCSWRRALRSTETVTRTWSLHVAGPADLRLEARPARFSLAPFAVQALTLTAAWAGEPSAGAGWRYGSLILVPEGGASPELRLPLALQLQAANLPRPIFLAVDAAAGSQRIDGLVAPLAMAPEVEVLGLIRPRVIEALVAQAPRGADPFRELTGTWATTLMVPPNSTRLSVRIAESASRDPELWVGRDSNGDGAPQIEELACASTSPEVGERCDLVAPEPGPWWLLVQNRRAAGAEDRLLLEVALPGPAAAGNLSARLTPDPAAPAPGAWRLQLNWQLPGLQPGDRWQGALRLVDPAGPSPLLGIVAVELLGLDRAPTATPWPSPRAEPTRPPGATARPSVTASATPPASATGSSTATMVPARVHLPWLGRRNRLPVAAYGMIQAGRIEPRVLGLTRPIARSGTGLRWIPTTEHSAWTTPRSSSAPRRSRAVIEPSGYSDSWSR